MILVYIAEPTPRARYVVEHVFHHMLGWDLSIVEDEEVFRRSGGAKLSYGDHPIDPSAFHIKASGWLKRSGIVGIRPEVSVKEGMPVLFPDENGYDLLSAAFFLISRYEEYLDHPNDEHGRSLPSALFLVEHGMHERPILDEWVLQLADRLRAMYPALPAPDRVYRHVVTADLDNGLKYLGRPFWKQCGAAIRDLVKGAPSIAQERFAVLRGKSPDPYADQQLLIDAARSEKVFRTIAFVLVQGGTSYDHAANIRHPAMVGSIRAMASEMEIGLHPSYNSSSDPSSISREKRSLEQVLSDRVTTSRQHFLRWDLPGTLRALEAAGIKEDHTLGFSDRIGLRAGTCTPFRWYDLQQDRISDLVLHPFASMDSALHDRMGLRPREAVRQMITMSEAIRRVNGQFVSVWHDRFLYGDGDRKGWPEAFKQVYEAVAP